MLDVHAKCRQIDSVDPYSVAYRVPNLPPDLYAKDVALSQADGTDKNILIAEVRGKIVAHCRVEWWHEWDPERNAEKTAYLIRAWVDPSWRRQGVGAYLLNWRIPRQGDGPRFSSIG